MGWSAVLLAATMIRAVPAGAQTSTPIIPLLRPDSITVRHDNDAVRSASPLILVGSESVDRLRFGQLHAGVQGGESLILRSASSLSSLPSGVAGIAWLAPQFHLVSNSTMPFSQNNGAVWAGKGTSTLITFGATLVSGRVRVILAPELAHSSNLDWQMLSPKIYEPPVPADRSGGGYVFPYYIGPFSIDQPMRFGKKPISRFGLGQSSFLVSAKSLTFGFSTENEWWGPGIRNALVLSDNAPGFGHFLIRTSHPIQTRFGMLSARWLVGGLTESKYFDTVSTNNVRSLSAIASTLQTGWDPNLSVGVARSVYANATGWGAIPFRWFDVFAATKRLTSTPPRNSTQIPGGRDQLLSLFARWVFPADGAEVYGEWARTELPASLRDFLVSPNHTQGYTFGLQWRHPALSAGDVRLQGEITSLEQSATFRDRPIGSWYTSRHVIQGYTNRGEVLGASIGPGGSSQWIAADYMKPTWSAGAYAGRIRWNEDFHSTAGLPVYVGYCSHDVSVYPGVRATRLARFGTLSVDVSWQNRMNAFFQNGGGCPNVGNRIDLRNTSFSLKLATLTSGSW